jgi:DNA-binding ferritin-like protein
MKFRDIVEKKAKNEDTVDMNEAVEYINSTGIGYIIAYTLQFAAQAHVWHLLCTNGQKHTALGELYEELQSEVDELAEKFIAQGGQLQTVSEPLIAYYDEDVIRARIDELRNIVTSAINTDPRTASIVDGVTDLQEVIDSKLYKFNLS